jgi:biopolymer transport protein ExbD
MSPLKKRRLDITDDTGIAFSPLIDCVFLLLIFFLVTTMLKRKETILPVVLPDASSSLSAQAREDVLVIGLDPQGKFLEPAQRDPYGALTYHENRTLDRYLDDLIAETGPAVFARPVRFDVARDTPFQKTIDALDAIKRRGFLHVSVKSR